MKNIKNIVLSLMLIVVTCFSLNSTIDIAYATTNTTETPTVSIDSATKGEHLTKTLTFNLTNASAYDSNTKFRVYTDSGLYYYEPGVDATLSGSTLTLTHAHSLRIGNMYVTATNTGSYESESLKINISTEKGKVAYWTTGKYDKWLKPDDAYNALKDHGFEINKEDSYPDFSDDFLYGASLLVAVVPKDGLGGKIGKNMMQVKSFLDNGGTVLFMGENPDYDDDFNEEIIDDINHLRGAGDMAITRKKFHKAVVPVSLDSTHPVFAGGANMGRSNSSSVTIDGNIRPLISFNKFPGHHLVVEEAVSNGRVMYIADANMFQAYDGITDDQVKLFFRNIVKQAKKHQDEVIAGNHSNKEFWIIPTVEAEATDVGITEKGKTEYTFDVIYTSRSGSNFDDKTIGTSDVTVTKLGNSRNESSQLTVTKVKKKTLIGDNKLKVTYAVTPPGGSWDGSDSDKYAIGINDDAVRTKDDKRIVAEPVVAGFKVNIPYTHTINFDANGGGGNMTEVKVKKGTIYTIPQNRFDEPDRGEFFEWEINEITYKPNSSLTVNEDVVIKAIWLIDTDGDGLTDKEEIDGEKYERNPDGSLNIDPSTGEPVVEEEFPRTDPKNPDTDGDGMTDGNEVAGVTDPTVPDYPQIVHPPVKPTSNPLVKPTIKPSFEPTIKPSFKPTIKPSSSEFDTDGDGLTDEEEDDIGTNPTIPDTDGDGLTDKEEIKIGTDSTNTDTDDDGISDKKELEDGTDPLIPNIDGDDSIIEEEESLDFKDDLNIDDNLSSGWSFFDLMLTLIAIIIALISIFKNKKDSEEYSKRRRNFGVFALFTSLIMFIVNIVIHDYSAPMRLYMNETILLFIVLTIISIGNSSYSLKYREEFEEYE